MLNKRNPVFLGLVSVIIAISTMGGLSASEISTLFTTPQERELINANRYKSNEVKPQVNAAEPSPVESIQPIVREEVTETLSISGITLSGSGPHMVWINSQGYEDGDKLDDKMRIKVMPGNEVKVRITAPDGKHYFATSGETIEVVYMAAVEN